MYRSVPFNNVNQRPAVVSRAVAERLVAERDALVSERQQLSAELQRTRLHLRSLSEQLQDSEAHVQALQRAAVPAPAPVVLPEPADDSARVRELLADLDNMRRHHSAALQRARDEASAAVLSGLIAARDDVERAVHQADGPVAEGLRAVVASLHRHLERSGATLFGRTGERFDPQLHEALALTDVGESGTVSEIVEPGVRLQSGALLRPARVTVVR